ncbi:MAG: hypothetical protein K9M10_03100 [Candidatus Pacebacteria bacterium]|nr:hypothetical protein [Candidatus Paceibacterota bacterium]MCF7857441.1 hypothetical protein [Candidatus Paceibacterota bacterium]
MLKFVFRWIWIPIIFVAVLIATNATDSHAQDKTMLANADRLASDPIDETIPGEIINMQRDRGRILFTSHLRCRHIEVLHRTFWYAGDQWATVISCTGQKSTISTSGWALWIVPLPKE